MADVQINELITTERSSTNDVFVLQIYSSGVGWLTRKISASALGSYLCTTLALASELTTDSKTVTGAINEVNAKNASDIAYKTTTIEDAIEDAEGAISDANDAIANLTQAITDLTNAQFYNTTDLVSLEEVVLPIYSNGTDLMFTIPLTKQVASDLAAEVTGEFIIDGVTDDIANFGTVTTTVNDIGVMVKITPSATPSLTDNFVVGATNALITFTEEES